jgi:hypothetical protein
MVLQLPLLRRDSVTTVAEVRRSIVKTAGPPFWGCRHDQFGSSSVMHVGNLPVYLDIAARRSHRLYHRCAPIASSLPTRVRRGVV